MLGLYRDKAKENGSYYIIGFYRGTIGAGVGSGGDTYIRCEVFSRDSFTQMLL